MDELLTRDEFRQQVFERDNHQCVMCDKQGKDAHHILERRLFEDGGYYLSNGATLCEEHHLQAETTNLSCDEIREAAGIKDFALPTHMYPDETYDKWGNTILANGTRTKGELFNDKSVQKVLAHGNVLDLFIDHVKYPRTFHLPWSPGATEDDRIMEDVSCFEGKDVVVTQKMDGENANLYHDYYHARSLDSRTHISRSWIRNFHSKMGYNIPEGWRICGENMFAVHSIKYDNLPTYFLGFSIWNEKNVCLSWGETEEWAKLLDITLVPVIYAGKWKESTIRQFEEVCKKDEEKIEGYVVRLANRFHYSEFKKSVAKYVRASHVRTHGHWMRSKFERNELASVVELADTPA